MQVLQVAQSFILTSIKSLNSVGSPSTKDWWSILRVSLSFVVAVAFIACAGETTQQPPSLASVVVTPASGTLVSLGETAQLTATARDASGNAITGVSFTWSSSDENCAAVNSAGLVTAVGNGTAEVTASTAGVSGSASITVAQTPASVEVDPLAASLSSLGETVQLAASAHDANGNSIEGTTFSWASSDDGVATVSNSGLVTAVGSGTASVTASAAAVSASASITVAQEAATVEVTPASGTLVSLGETVQLTASARDAGDNAIVGKTFAWSSSDDGIATVSSSGLVTAVANGSATVTAVADGVSDSASITVAQVLAAVAVTPTAATLTSLGETAQLVAAAHDANGNPIAGKTFTWASSADGLVTVNTAGLVTAVANGTATITATTDGVEGTAEVTVAQEAASIAVSPLGASISGVGATQQFTLEARDAGGSLIPDPSATWSSLNPNVATINSSTGEATAVASGQVTIAATVDGTTRYALLTVAVPGVEPVNLWSEMRSGSSGDDALGIWGTSATDVYVVSYDGILHYDGTSWSAMADEPSVAVWGTSATDIYLVSWDGGIVHYDGTNWRAMQSGTGSHLTAVWGTSPADVYAVAGPGVILHYDGTTWSDMPSGTFAGLQDVWGTSATDVYAVGGDGVILHYDGTSWRAMASGISTGVTGVWGSSPTDVYAVGDNGVILHYNGTNWSEMESGTGSHLGAVWGTSTADVYVVGVAGVILRGVRGASVVVTPSAHSLTAGGATVQLAAEARDADDNAISGVRFAWSSSDLSVASVDATGLVTAVANGTATITATAPGGAAASASITVDLGQAPTATITSPANGTSFAEGATITFSGSATDPEDGDLIGSALVWTSSLDGQIGTGASFTRNDL